MIGVQSRAAGQTRPGCRLDHHGPATVVPGLVALVVLHRLADRLEQVVRVGQHVHRPVELQRHVVGGFGRPVPGPIDDGHLVFGHDETIPFVPENHRQALTVNDTTPGRGHKARPGCRTPAAL